MGVKDHKDLTEGDCSAPAVKCTNDKGYKICASLEGVDISDIIELDSVHAWYEG